MATLDTATRTIPAGALGAEQNLASWAGEYVTDMLGKAQALTDLGYQPYQGALTAGPSALQSQVFQGLGALTIPQNITQAGSQLGQVAQRAGSMSYTPTAFQSTYQAPAEYRAGTFDNRFVAPTAYQGTNFSPEAYSQTAIQPYMNPYLESVLEPQRREAQRQAEIARNQMQSRMAQAGAYGGSRQAIMEAEAQRNLMTQLGDITGKGYASAFDTAQQQFAAEQARRMQAEQLREQSRQFGAQQGMTAAELQARYGLSADQAAEASRQFAAQQAGQQAQLAAQYGLEAGRLGEQSRQFGASYGLDALSRQMQALQAQGAMGQAEAQTGLANLAAQLQGGNIQRDIEQQGLTADYQQYLREQAYPYEQLKFQQSMLAGLPIAATAYAQPEQDPFSAFTGGMKDLIGSLVTLGVIPAGGSTTTAPPAATSPVVNTPTVTTPTVTTPTVTTPTVTTPTVTTPTVNAPTVTSPAVTSPIITPAPTSTPPALSPVVSNNVFNQPSVIGGGGTFTPTPTTMDFGLMSLPSFGRPFFEAE
jgi:hypothetical protein